MAEADPEYKTIDGEPTTLDALCRSEPAWAANRIRFERDRAAKAEAERDVLLEQCTVIRQVDHIECEPGEGIAGAVQGLSDAYGLAEKENATLRARLEEHIPHEVLENILDTSRELSTEVAALRIQVEILEGERREARVSYARQLAIANSAIAGLRARTDSPTVPPGVASGAHVPGQDCRLDMTCTICERGPSPGVRTAAEVLAAAERKARLQMGRPDIDRIRKCARMTNWHKEADVLTLCDYVERLEALLREVCDVADQWDPDDGESYRGDDPFDARRRARAALEGGKS